MEKIKDSELVLNTDNSVYHLHVKGVDIADTILLVGDPDRVAMISDYFDRIDFKVQNREMATHTGWLNGHRLTVLSTGMGTDNLDIVINELDAAANIDLDNRMLRGTHRKLNLIRLGTSGALQAEIAVESMIMSEYVIGLDGMVYFYGQRGDVLERNFTEAFIRLMGYPEDLPKPYVVRASGSLMEKMGDGFVKGCTATAPGFYGPQGRVLRLPLAYPATNKKIESFEWEGHRVTNFEMESSALYALGQMLGHDTLTICTIIANRVTGKFSRDYKSAVRRMIETVLERLTQNQ